MILYMHAHTLCIIINICLIFVGTIVVDSPTSASASKLSRAARTQLSKLGVEDTVDLEGLTLKKTSISPELQLELNDDRRCNVISFTFAAYRSLSDVNPPPKSVFFSFQFYSCLPTKTDSLSLFKSLKVCMSNVRKLTYTYCILCFLY